MGAGPGQFKNIQLISGGYNGSQEQVAAADYSNHDVQVFDSDGTFEQVIGNPTPSSTPGYFNGPDGVYLTGMSVMYVSDENNSRVQVFTRSCAATCGQFSYSTNWNGGGGQITSSASGIGYGLSKIYVADPSLNVIQVFSSAGVYQTQYTSSGVTALNGPSDVKQGNGSNNLYIADTNNSRIVVMDSSGNFVSAFGTFGTGPGQFKFPSSLDVDNFENIYVADTGNNRIQVFDKFGTYLSSFGSLGSGPGQVNMPLGVATYGLGAHVYASDHNNSRIVRFDKQ